MGRGSLPAPAAGGFETAFEGHRDCRWIELSGVMQSVVQGSHEAVAQVVYGAHRYQARILAPVEALARFVNADVKLRGVVGALFNDRRQMLGIVLYVPGADYIQVERPAPADLFGIPLQSVENILQFSPGAAAGHRVRLRGVITAAEPGGAAWIEDATGAIGIRDHGEEQVAVGDIADVVGFPAPGAYSPILTNAKIRRVGGAKVPAPAPFTAAQLLDGGHDGRLVQVEGVLVDRTFSAGRLVLLLKSGHNQFTASLEARSISRMPEPGALLRVAGICSTLVDDSRESVAPRSFEIRMRSPQDLTILKQPPWLTFERLLPLFLITLAIAAVALSWASRLRRRLQAQANTLVQKTVQLEKEHHAATRALRRAQEAEVMEQAHKNVLELVARDEDLNGVLMQLAQAVEEHCPGVSCAIQLRLPEGQRLGASPSLPRDWQLALAKVEIEEFAATGVHPLAGLSAAAAWREVADAPAGRLQRVCVAPIERELRVIGVVLAFPAGEIVLRRSQLDFLTSASQLAALAVERRVLYDQLSHQAQHDELTGLENRAALMARLAREIGLAAAAGRLLGVIYIDLDNFKHVNDTLGHAAGDAVLKEVAQRMHAGVRCSDTLARLGGDEFVVVLPNLGHRADAQRIASQLVASLAEPIPFSGQALVIGASAGTAIYPLDGNDPDALLTAADHRMYHEKSFRHYTGPAETAPRGSKESQMVS
jgi:diguanylate cyclase (GGDEF)-like protein